LLCKSKRWGEKRQKQIFPEKTEASKVGNEIATANTRAQTKSPFESEEDRYGWVCPSPLLPSTNPLDHFAKSPGSHLVHI
jgi:hypothetical protein